MNKKLLLTLATITALALPSFAAKTEKEGKKEHAGGIVKSVNADSHTLTVARGKKDKTETYKVGKDVDLSKVKTGEMVKLKISDDNVVQEITPFEKKKKDK